MKEALTNLLKIDSLITLGLLITFCVGCFLQMLCGVTIPEPLVELFKLVVMFYFGCKTGRTAQKLIDAVNSES